MSFIGYGAVRSRLAIAARFPFDTLCFAALATQCNTPLHMRARRTVVSGLAISQREGTVFLLPSTSTADMTTGPSVDKKVPGGWRTRREKRVADTRPPRACGRGRRRALDAASRPHRNGPWGDRCYPQVIVPKCMATAPQCNHLTLGQIAHKQASMLGYGRCLPARRPPLNHSAPSAIALCLDRQVQRST